MFRVLVYAKLTLYVGHLLTDKRTCYKFCKFCDVCLELGAAHKCTRPYRPQTNGKAEHFIRTALKKWIYAQTYTHSWKRTAHLPVWTEYHFSPFPQCSWQKTSGFSDERRVNNVLAFTSSASTLCYTHALSS